MTASVTLTMDQNNLATLVDILERQEARCKAIAAMRHTTEAEKVVLIGEAAVCQYAYLQIQGIQWQPPVGPPVWSAAEASGKAKCGNCGQACEACAKAGVA